MYIEELLAQKIVQCEASIKALEKRLLVLETERDADQRMRDEIARELEKLLEKR